MKEITAIIRMNKIQPSKNALLEAGFPSLTVQMAKGRGKQKGLRYEFNPPLKVHTEKGIILHKIEFIPKRLVTIVVEDKCVQTVIDILTEVNRTGNPGDGKIFVGPVLNVHRVRTSEVGNLALL